MAAASFSAAESNSLHPSVPASVAVRDMSTFAPARDGGLPSSLITVARTTSSPRASRCASSSSTLGTCVRSRENGTKDGARARDLLVGGRVARGQAQTPQGLVHRQPHRQQDVRRVERAGRASGSARRGHPGKVERQEQVLAPPRRKRGGGVVGESILSAGEPAAELLEGCAQVS